MENPMLEIKETFDRWYDIDDFPEDARDEIIKLIAGYVMMELFGQLENPVDKIELLIEMNIATFRIGQAHAHEPLVGEK
jgi:hypothetical protein